MNYRHFLSIWLTWAISVGSCWVGVSEAGANPVPADLEEMAPVLAARRLSTSDFARSREQWARFYGYRQLEARVREVKREGDWVRVDFDERREGGAGSGEVFRLAWNEGEEGPAPFAWNQRVRIWVSPEGEVDGFVLGQAVQSWRHLPDGKVELLVLDETVDGGRVLVRMIPDRYAGAEVGTTVYWKGEGLGTGATGMVPLGRKIHEEDLDEAREGVDLERAVGKTFWVRPGLTSCEEEIRALLRDYAAGAGSEEEVIPVAANGSAGAEMGREEGGSAEPFKIRLQREAGGGVGQGSKPALRPVSKGSTGSTGWGRSAAPAAAKKSGGSSGPGENPLAALFGKSGGKAPEKPATAVNELKEAARGVGSAPASAPVAAPAVAAATVAGAAPAAERPTGESAGEAGAEADTAPAVVEERVRVDERWYGILRDRALRYRREAFEALSSSRTPGSAVSQTWVDVVYENQAGEPLRVSAALLPRVPLEQFVPESRGMP